MSKAKELMDRIKVDEVEQQNYYKAVNNLVSFMKQSKNAKDAGLTVVDAVNDAVHQALEDDMLPQDFKGWKTNFWSGVKKGMGSV
tara:strand:- start:2224 stop:2478 length:255 start_codon:yes stop_codon:yes gene_type:complete